jgi:hypothetical protein
MGMTAPRHEQDPMLKKPGEYSDEEIIKVLGAYFSEAEHVRASGPVPRDTTWQQNWNRYWGLYDMSQKADWQAKHVMPVVSEHVDRWAAAMRAALAQGGQWFHAVDDTGAVTELSPHIEKFMKIILARCYSLPDGHEADFEAFFEDQMKLGALQLMCASVVVHGNRVRVESVLPSDVWLDGSGRNMYRIRRRVVDMHQLEAMREKVDSADEPLYHREAMDMLLGAQRASAEATETAERERASGHGQPDGGSNRNEVVLKEYLCTLVMPGGDVLGRNVLIVVADDKYIIRGPEENPFWHGRDWMVTAPMVPVPTSVYGKSYLESWSNVADAFIDLTNLILDGVFTTTMKAYAGDSSKLRDPGQITEGVTPNKFFDLESGSSARQFIQEIDFGNLPAEAFQTWNALKNEIREGAKQNEISLGQIPQKGGITATEADLTTQRGSAMEQSMARSIEMRFLEPTLTMMWFAALQHTDFSDPQIVRVLGEETAGMLASRREEFRDSTYHFRVTGLSAVIERQHKLRSLLTLLQTLAQSEPLMQAFMQEVPADGLMRELVRLFGINMDDLKGTPSEQMLRRMMPQIQGQAGQQAPAPQGESMVPPGPQPSGIL